MTLELIGDSAVGERYAAVRLVVDGERIVEADAPGLDRELAGLTLIEAAAVPGETLAADALANALSQAFTASHHPGRVAVAMSGGVDSAVALVRAGRDAIGVTLRLWADPRGRSAERICCSPSAVIAARQACHDRGLPHVTLDLREEFRDAVVAPFVADYAAGLTPNPCSRCNGAFRFDRLVEFARVAGTDALWTGHYARIVERDGVRLVARGLDVVKDQSYMLATVAPSLLAGIGFPLGSATKDEIRAEARTHGLAAAGRPESQEACFLAGDDYRAFLGRHGVGDTPGTIVDESGRELGRHDGLWRYTPGQRRGIGVAAAEPLYALRGEATTNTLVVGPRRALEVTRVEALGRLYVAARQVEVKLRYRSPAVPATVEVVGETLAITLSRPVEGVAPGQIAALYDGDAVVGAGVIISASR